MQYLAICRCPMHREFWAVTVEDEEGSGTRLTPSKCCGRWETVTRWLINERLRAAAIDEIGAAPSEDSAS